jgi:hypothetical protein
MKLGENSSTGLNAAATKTNEREIRNSKVIQLPAIDSR